MEITPDTVVVLTFNGIALNATNLVPSTQTALTDLPPGGIAGVMTTRAAAKASRETRCGGT